MPKLILLLVCTILIALPACASSIARLPLRELPDCSDAIILGEVIEVAEQNNANLDDLSIRVHSVIKGEIASPVIRLTLSTRGGIKDFDPRLKIGDTGVFFLKQQNGNFSKAYWGSIATFAKPNFSTNDNNDEPPVIFPKIPAGIQSASLAFIADYARKHNWLPIAGDSLRLVIQPMGIVAAAYEVNLKTGIGRIFPGTHQNNGIATFTFSDNDLQRLIDTVSSAEFKSLGNQVSKIGMDGTSYLIEVDRDGNYQWLWRWQPDEAEIKTLIELLTERQRSVKP